MWLRLCGGHRVCVHELNALILLTSSIDGVFIVHRVPYGTRYNFFSVICNKRPTEDVLKKFPLGNRHKTDFVVPMASSGMWEVQMIELEPPDDKVINVDGTTSRRLKEAMSQIGDWKSYIDENRDPVRRDLSEWCMKHDLLKFPGSSGPPRNFTGNYLRAPETYVRYYYHIVIGRRDRITEEQRRKMNQISQCIPDLKICTYGSLLDAAKKIDELK